MRHRKSALPVLAAAAAALLVAAPAGAAPRRGPRGPLERLENRQTMASAPLDLQALAGGDLSGVPSDAFDPAAVDEIAGIRGGQVVAWTTTLTTLGIPGGSREVVLFRKNKGRVRVKDAAGDDDQPRVGTDSFGVRLVWRGSEGARGTTVGNIWIRSTRIKPGTPPEPGAPPPKAVEESVTEQITKLVAAAGGDDPEEVEGTAYDPALCARTRVREIDAGVTVKERDARVAFVSTGDIVAGRNPAGVPQLFVWHEQEDRFFQITSIPLAGSEVNRPSIDASGTRIAFECSADLTPDAVDPKTAAVGNPSGVRQIYLWQEGRGIRQLTWSDRDCLAPQLARNGRFVVFCSRGDPIPGGNPDGNFEVFAWAPSADPASALRQMTRTAVGHNVLPRPGRSPQEFAYWSTSEDGSAIPLPLPESLSGLRIPLAWVQRGERRTLVGGWTWEEQETGSGNRFLSVLGLLGIETGSDATYENPVISGPPCLVGDPRRPLFVTNDITLNRRRADDDLDGDNGGGDPLDPLPDDRAIDASILSYHVARALPRGR